MQPNRTDANTALRKLEEKSVSEVEETVVSSKVEEQSDLDSGYLSVKVRRPKFCMFRIRF